MVWENGLQFGHCTFCVRVEQCFQPFAILLRQDFQRFDVDDPHNDIGLILKWYIENGLRGVACKLYIFEDGAVSSITE
jgi:hypothetical protein